MSFKPIIIVGGEPKSIFLEILLKSLKKLRKRSKPIILISSKDLLHKNMKKFHQKFRLNELNKEYSNLKRDKINLINIEFKDFSFSKRKITNKSNKHISKSFNEAIYILKKKKCAGLINGPISKKNFLSGNFNEIKKFLACPLNTSPTPRNP